MARKRMIMSGKTAQPWIKVTVILTVIGLILGIGIAIAIQGF